MSSTTIDEQFSSLLDQLQASNPGSLDRRESTPVHNKAVGGAPGSAHIFLPSAGIKCRAADMQYDTHQELCDAARAAISLEFSGVELDLTNNHLHVDTLPRVSRWLVVHHGPGNEEPLVPWLDRNA